MISKQFRIVNGVLAAIGIAAFIFFQYQMRPNKLGGFEEGTEEYYGYQYARDNNLKSADQCDDERDDPEMNINEKFLDGCRSSFEK
ncbi:hypothetical protein [Acinetobacter sp.]|uniref:hypothetical protein n=1 Tax=Acinetobacter sp. TaxID=472 RepID=UPI002FC7941A